MADDEDAERPWSALSKKMTQMEEVANEARMWMDHTRPLVTGPHRDLRYVINMDQTPVFFQ